MQILGIETSCDDTSVALLEASGSNFRVLAEKTASQIEVHKKYGGVVPEVAGRLHAEHITPVVEAVMEGQKKPDAIAVTSGPGLITSLLVGVETAKALSYLWDVPLVGINHIEGHIHSVEITNQKIAFPALCLVVSGGHTELILMKDYGVYERIGATRDDAAGECFDKVAKLLGFEYPGGPKISKMAEGGNPGSIPFPRPMLDAENYEFSFAGLKTAALYWLRDHSLSAAYVNPLHLSAGIFGQTPEEPTMNDFCASLEQAIVDVLVAKTMQAAKEYKPQSILLVGGVSANKKLRQTLEQATRELLPAPLFLTPELRYCMDNGAMIGAAGYYQVRANRFAPWRELKAEPNWIISEPL